MITRTRMKTFRQVHVDGCEPGQDTETQFNEWADYRNIKVVHAMRQERSTEDVYHDTLTILYEECVEAG